MKILLVITGLKMGGAENQICDLADKFVKLGHKVTIISLLDLVEIRPKNNDIKLITINLNKFNFIYCLVKFVLLIKKLDPDVIHANLFHAIIFSRISRVFVKTPNIICTHHGMQETKIIRRFVFRITDFLTDINTAVSESSAKAFIESNSGTNSKVKVVYNGIDLSNFKPQIDHRVILRDKLEISSETFVLLAVGRLVWEKDYENLLASFNLCLSKTDNLHLIIIGDGPLKTKLINKVKNLNIDKKVTFLGKRDDTKLWYNVADVFVSSSKREGFGLAIIEAIASKIPVVSTCEGIVSKFPNNLIIFAKTMNYKSLSEAIIKVLNKNSFEKEMISDKLYVFVEKNFCLDKVASTWLKIYFR